MKKLIFLALVALLTSASALAINPAEYAVYYKLNEQGTFRAIERYLKVSDAQAEILKAVFTETEVKLNAAIKNENPVAAEKAVRNQLINVREVLSYDQYKKFLTALNVTIYNYRNSDVYFAEK